MRQIYLNRSKIFNCDVDGAARTVALGRTSNGKPVAAPEWIVETATYKLGIKDGSIVDLTPPAPAPVVKTEEAAIEAAALEPVMSEDHVEEDAPKAKPAKDAGKAVGLKASSK